jgi:hypothetical protein
MALQDRVATPVERADFDDLVTLVTQAPPWEKDRVQGIRILLRAIGDGKATAPDQIIGRWVWKLARATRKVQDRRASSEYPEAKRLLGAVANSRGHRHEENVAKLVNVALAQPIGIAVALLASAEGYTPRANQLIDAARERLGELPAVANALADNLPAPKAQPGRSRRRRRRKKGQAQLVPATTSPAAPQEGEAVAEPPSTEGEPGAPEQTAKPKRRRKPAAPEAEAPAETVAEPETEPKPRPTRTRRPKADVEPTEAVADAEPAPKPKRTRTRKPKTAEPEQQQLPLPAADHAA